MMDWYGLPLLLLALRSRCKGRSGYIAKTQNGNLSRPVLQELAQMMVPRYLIGDCILQAHKAVYNKALITLTKRVKKLEKQLKHKKRRVVIDSSEDEGPSLDAEDSPKQGRMIEEVDKDETHRHGYVTDDDDRTLAETLLNIKRSAAKGIMQFRIDLSQKLKRKAKYSNVPKDRSTVIEIENGRLKPIWIWFPYAEDNLLWKLNLWILKKKYPLTQEMLSKMLSRKLEVDHENEMAFELLRVIHKTNVSRPQLRSTQMKDKVVPSNSHVKDKKTEVEDHHRISSTSNKTKSVTVSNDSLKSKTSNVNVVCATCGKCVFNSNHDACVSKYLNNVNARTKKPKVVPISTRKPKSQAIKSVATPHKKTVAS
ncbi:hypothetical protein Tco_1301443 [Tanacetum coccineum]